MEMLFVGIIVLAAIWFFDFDRPLKEAADMANREVSLQNAVHKSKAVRKLSGIELKANEVSKAKAVLAQLDSFDL